ncbi:MAG: holo-ACP synthase [Campylobacterales bacterium]
MVGIDIVSIDRFERFLEKYDKKALMRFLSKEEIELVKSPKSAAGFWAIKESVAKALGCGIGGELSFFDIIISKTKKGAPEVFLSQRAKERFGDLKIHTSVTHDAGIAASIVYIDRR